MNTQRMVIYEQRRRVLEGEDLSDDMREWIEEVVSRTVDQFTDAEFAEEWDLAGLVTAMQSLYGTDMTVDELREEVDVTSREALREEFVEDALDAYAEKEEELGAELMREVERFVILNIVDQRWRGHLDSMDYLREGVHLRAFAQKDPLVEYRAEGHALFEELSQTIREEVVLTVFHAQVQMEPDQLQPAAQDGNGNLQYQHETAAGADAIAGAASAGGATAVAGSTATAALAPRQETVVNEHRDIGRNDPCWCGSGKKFKKCHGA
jgi:preprotein translocase subunit SecA